MKLKEMPDWEREAKIEVLDKLDIQLSIKNYIGCFLVAVLTSTVLTACIYFFVRGVRQ